MKTWAAVLIAIIGSSAMGALAGLLVDAVKRKWKKTDDEDDNKNDIKELRKSIDCLTDTVKDVKEQQKKQSDLSKILAIDRISYLGECHIASGEIAIDEKQRLKTMHARFVALDGEEEHDLDVIMDAVDKLKEVPSWLSKSTAKAE